MVMAAVSLISFSLFNFVGDPVNNMVGQEATREDRVQIREALGLDDPIFTQYTRFICLLYTSPSPRDQRGSRMPSSA